MKNQEIEKEQQSIIDELIDCQQRVNDIENLRTQEKETLVEAKAVFENLFEFSPDALIVVDRRGRIKQMNTQAERLFGYTRKELIGKDHGILVPARFRKKHSFDLKAYMKQPRIRIMGIGLELYGLRRDGTEFPADIDLGPLKTGKNIEVLSLVRDVTPRKQLEQDLLESEERYRQIVELSPNAVVISSEGRVVFVNTTGARLFGTGSVEPMIGKPVIDFVHPDYRQAVAERVRRVIEEGKVVPLVEEKLLRYDGSAIWAEAVSLPYTYRGKRGMLSIIRDITERKEAERERREAEERIRRTLDGMLEACIIIDFNWRYLYVNNAAVRLGRRTKEERLGRTMMEVFPGIEKQDTFAHLQKCMQDRVPEHYETEFTFPEGNKGWFEVRAEPIPEGIFVLYMDITQRKKFEEELNQYRQRLEEAVVERASQLMNMNTKLVQEIAEHQKTDDGARLQATILDSSIHPIFLINLAGNFTYVNESACRMYGYNRTEFLSMNLRQLLPPQDAPMVESRLKEVFQKRRLDVEAIHLRKDGTPIPVRVFHTITRTPHGEFIVSVSREMTDEYKLRSLLEQIPCLLWTTDNDLRLTLLRGKLLEVIGLKPGAGEGMALSEFLERNGFEATALVVHQRALAGITTGYEIKNSKTGNGYCGSAAPLRNSLGDIIGTINILLEMTGS